MLHLSNVAFFIILYCSSLFVLFQAEWIAVLGHGATSISRAALLLLMTLIFAVHGINKNSTYVNIRYLSLYALFFLGLMANYLFHLQKLEYPEKYYMAFFCVIISAIIACKRIHPNVTLPVWLGPLVATYFFVTVLQRVFSSNFGSMGRISLDNELTSSLNYLPIAAFLLAVYFHTMSRRVLVLISATTVILLILLTQSRSAFIGIGAAVFFLFLKDSGSALRKTLFLFIFASTAGLLLSINNLYHRFYFEIIEVFSERTNRISIILDLFAGFVSSPLFGSGFATHQSLRYDPHNMFLEVSLQGGVIGVITMVPILAIGIRSAFRVYGSSPLGNMASVGCICLMVYGQFTGSLLLDIPLWLFIGLCLSLERKRYIGLA